MARDMKKAGPRTSADKHFSEVALSVIKQNREILQVTNSGRPHLSTLVAEKIGRDSRGVKLALDQRSDTPIQPGTKAVIISWIADKLDSSDYWALMWDENWRRWPMFDGCSGIEDAIQRIEAGPGSQSAPEKTKNTTTLTARISMPQNEARLLSGTYVSYRYALESRPGTLLLAREVVRVDEAVTNGCLPFQMSYRMTAEEPLDYNVHDKKDFQGNVQVIGESFVFTSIHLESDKADEQFKEDRVRFIVLPTHTTEIRPHPPRFGLMTTSRAKPPYDSCAACIVLMPVLFGLAEEDYGEFDQHVTKLRTLDDVMATDFAGLSDVHRAQFQDFLSNAPVVHADGPDPVVKLHHDRFNYQILAIFQSVASQIETTFRTAPFGPGWREGR